MQRKIWSQEEDKALKQIIEVKKITKWSAVSRAMEVDYELPTRTGKQCRERWHNQLDPQFSNQNWTKEQQEILFTSHNQVGNKWAKISTFLPGRTDNYIKNHFYSTLRKAVRRVNKFLFDIKDREIREIKNVLLNKILSCAQDKFENKMNISEDVIQLCIQIKNQLIPFANLNDLTSQQENSLKQLLQHVITFTKLYKKKRPKKKKKKVDIMEENLDEEVAKKETSRKRISRHSLSSNLFPIANQVTTTQIGSNLPLFATTFIQSEHLPDFLKNKFMSTSQQLLFDTPTPFNGMKLFDADNSRVLFNSNNFSLQASAGPNLFQSNIFKMLQSSMNFQRPLQF